MVSFRNYKNFKKRFREPLKLNPEQFNTSEFSLTDFQNYFLSVLNGIIPLRKKHIRAKQA